MRGQTHMWALMMNYLLFTFFGLMTLMGLSLNVHNVSIKFPINLSEKHTWLLSKIIIGQACK